MWAKTHVTRTQVARTHVAKTQARAGPESGVGRGPVYTRSGYFSHREKFDPARPEAKREHRSFWGGLTGQEKVDWGSLLSRLGMKRPVCLKVVFLLSFKVFFQKSSRDP